MYSIALKMLMGDRGKYFGIIMGITFATLIMTQQPSIFFGLMTRTYGFITDAGLADVWVMDPRVQYVDDVKPMQDTQLYRVRSVPGVEWAVPMYKGMLKVRLENGNFQTCNVIGLDDTSLIGGPAIMLQGKLDDLRSADGVIIDQDGAVGKLAKKPVTAGGKPVPLKIGDTLELNDKRAIVVGIAKASPTFQSQPVLYTTYSRAMRFAPNERKMLSFILVKAHPGESVAQLKQRITERTGLAAYDRDEFKTVTMNYFMKNTGIPINFGIAVLLGFIVGAAIAGQTFYNFTLENLKQFGVLKAMGVSNGLLLRMILLQAAVAGSVGYGLGVGATAWFGSAMKESVLAFHMTWHLLVFSGTGVLLICFIAALISIRTVIKLEPAVVFK